MSLSAKSAVKTRSAIRDRYINAEAEQDILSYLEGCYEAEVPRILTKDEIKMRRLCRWMVNRLDVMARVGLACPDARPYADAPYGDRPDRYELGSDNRYHAKWRLSDYSETVNPQIFPHSLLDIGVNTPADGNRFLEFYLKVYDPGRSWVSGCQVNQLRAASIALTPNYNRLPDWVRKGLMDAPESAKIGGDRIGNIWRLIPCVKAWKWAPSLPKNLAEKIGKLSPKMRMLSAWAWANVNGGEYRDGEYHRFSRAEEAHEFWSLLKMLEKLSLPAFLEWALKNGRVSHYAGEDYVHPATAPEKRWGRHRWAAFLTASLNLPWGLIDLPKKVELRDLEDAIAQYASPRVACQTLFGCAGKATEQAFQSSDKNRWQWARHLGNSNPDAVQKILALENCIEFQEEAIDFLKSLPMQSRIRLLGATNFKYRGAVNPISNDHVRDTGYLWKNIQQKPELGRIRCWFSVHETLSAAFVKELPDEALPIPTGWERVDGLCAVNGSWTLEFPRRVATLKYYGEALRNCVGGYGSAIKSGRSVIFVVRERGLLTHCVEVSGGRVNQFYRSGNSSPDYSVKESVEAALRQAGLL